MDGLDLVIVAAVVFAMVGGYRLGFLARVLSFVGLALGFFVAIRVLPVVITHMTTATAATLLVVTVVILVGGAMLGSALGLLAGAPLHRALPIGPARMVDRGAGALVGGAWVLAIYWLLVPSLAQVQGWPAQAVTHSAIARALSRDLPAPPPALDLLRRIIGNGNPEVFSALNPNRASGPPPAVSGLSRSVEISVLQSTVRVQGQACDELIEGSGFAVADDLIATNAHVVAGEPEGQTQVLLPTGRVLPATVVLYDPNRDLALLSVPGLGETPLSLAPPADGQVGAVFGHPEGQAQVAVIPAQVSQIETARGPNIYGDRTVNRAILILAARLAHGDSGGALVNAGGQVIGVAFAISAESATTAYALNSSELATVLAEPHSAPVSTGACLTSG